MADVRFDPGPRPDVPQKESPEDYQWRKESAITYQGGYISATYGNLAQTFDMGKGLGVCSSVEVNRKAYTTSRTNKIGGDSKTVNVPSSTFKRFPRKNGGPAEGGGVYTFQTDVGNYTARVGGDVETAIQWICDNTDNMFGTLTVWTDRGAQYGPFARTTT